MKNKSGYLKVMEELWNTKDIIYKEIKEKGFENYFEYLKENTKDLLVKNNK